MTAVITFWLIIIMTPMITAIIAYLHDIWDPLPVVLVITVILAIATGWIHVEEKITLIENCSIKFVENREGYRGPYIEAYVNHKRVYSHVAYLHGYQVEDLAVIRNQFRRLNGIKSESLEIVPKKGVQPDVEKER